MQRTYFTPLMALILLFSSALKAQDKIGLEKAIQEKKIRLAIQGQGCYRGECLRIALKNLSPTPLSILVPAGQIFVSKDSNLQNLMVTAEQMVSVPARQSKFLSLTTMCIQSYNASPGKGAKFSLGKLAEDHLLRLAEFISEENYQSTTAQSAVWSVANDDPIKYIYGQDTNKVRRLAEIVSEATGSPLAEFRLTPTPHEITNINSSLESFLKDYVHDLRLALYDSADNLIRTYFEGREYEAGFYQWKVGANHYMGEEAKVYLRLFEGDQLLQEKLLSPSDTILNLQRMNVEAILNYILAEEKKGRVGVYDEEGRLYFLLAEDETFEEGYHRSRYIAKTYVLEGHEYYMKIVSEEEVLASAKLDLRKKSTGIQPKQKNSGKFEIILEETVENATLGIYDEEGKLKRMLYEINRLSPGTKTFTYGFTHHDGPDARFFARLLDAEGKVLWEKELE